jgi:HPt (histidine-containing phosphotransfer) domain-containing protein
MNHLAEHVVPTRYSSVGQRDPALAVEARLFRHAEALDMLGGDEQLMHEVVVIAMAELVRQRDALREALISSDAPTARRHAHTLKGTVATLAATAVRDQALLVERACSVGDVEAGRAQFPALAALVSRLLVELGEFRDRAHA